MTAPAVTAIGRFVLFKINGKSFIHAFGIVWLLVLLASMGRAQFTNANLLGTISDPIGAPVAGARVTVTNIDTGLERNTASDQTGSYSFTALPVGQYRITVEKAGFSKYAQSGITLVVAQSATVPVKLQMGSVTEQVNISANAEMVTTETGMVAHLVDQKRILDLPLNGRQPQTLLFLAPGTVNETGKYCLVNCQGGVYPGQQDANVGGAGPRSVNFQMDGAGHNDSYVNTNLPFPNPDAVQEFNLQSDNLSAQYGMGAGAVVNIITRSGTNTIHGDVFEFVRNGDMNARNFFAPKQDTLKRNQYGGSIGGPILKDKLFYFGTYQGTRIRSAAQGSVVSSRPQPNGPVISLAPALPSRTRSLASLMGATKFPKPAKRPRAKLSEIDPPAERSEWAAYLHGSKPGAKRRPIHD